MRYITQVVGIPPTYLRGLIDIRSDSYNNALTIENNINSSCTKRYSHGGLWFYCSTKY